MEITRWRRWAPLLLCLPGLLSCASPAKPYRAPKSGAVASVLLLSDAGDSNGVLNMGLYDHPATDCRATSGYLGFVRHARADAGKAIVVPAGRRLQFSPGYSTGRAMCMTLDSYSFAPAAGQTYRIRHAVRTETVPCTKSATGAVPDGCGTLLTEVERRYCEFHVEQKAGTEWAPVADAQRIEFRQACPTPAGAPAK